MCNITSCQLVSREPRGEMNEEAEMFLRRRTARRDANAAAWMLAFREDLGPDDYELMLALDGCVRKEGLSSKCLSQNTTLVQGGGGGGTECAICLETPSREQTVRRLRCEHEYHAVCVDTWFRESTTCPVCKHDVSDSKPSETSQKKQ